MPKKDQKEKIRLNLELTPEVNEHLQDLKNRTGSASLTEVLRRAIALYNMVTAVYEKDGSVVFRYADGKEEKLRIL